MKLWIPSALLVALPGGHALSTRYATERALRFEIVTSLQLETTSMEIERDGEPVDWQGGGRSSTSRRREVHIDRALAVEDGKPTRVRRAFESVEGRNESTFGDNSRETEIESPLDGVTIEIARDDEGEVEVRALEGGRPDEEALEGHTPEAFLDAFLPEGEVETGTSWDLDADVIRRGLRLDVSKALYPPPARGEDGEDGGGRRRGMRGGRGGGAQLLQDAEWKGTAELVETDAEIDGVACCVIRIELEASGELEEPDFGGGGRRGRAFFPESGPVPVETSYQVTLEGKLHFATKEKRPLSLDLEGTAKIESEREMSHAESTMRIHSVQEGIVTFKVGVGEEAVEAEK